MSEKNSSSIVAGIEEGLKPILKDFLEGAEA